MNPVSLRLLAAVAAALPLAACDGIGLGGGGQVSLNVMAQGSANAALRPPSVPDTLVDAGGNVLVINKVEIVLRDIEFERQNHDSCDSSASSDDCEKFNGGPLLLDLPLNGSLEHAFSLSADSGLYDEVRLRIHKPEDDGDDRDRAFLAIHPDLAEVSIRVTGSFNGNGFTYTTDLNADQEFVLSPPLAVTGEADVSITLRVDVARWFVSGAALVNPALALKGGAFESVVENNIESSFEAYRDDDRDGEDDDS